MHDQNSWVPQNNEYIKRAKWLLYIGTACVILSVFILPVLLGVCDQTTNYQACFADEDLNELFLILTILFVYFWHVFYYIRNTKFKIHEDKITIYDRGKIYDTSLSNIKLGFGDKMLITDKISIPFMLGNTSKPGRLLYDIEATEKYIEPLLAKVERINRIQAYKITLQQLNPVTLILPVMIMVIILLG